MEFVLVLLCLTEPTKLEGRHDEVLAVVAGQYDGLVLAEVDEVRVVRRAGDGVRNQEKRRPLPLVCCAEDEVLKAHVEECENAIPEEDEGLVDDVALVGAGEVHEEVGDVRRGGEPERNIDREPRPVRAEAEEALQWSAK